MTHIMNMHKQKQMYLNKKAPTQEHKQHVVLQLELLSLWYV